jgi:transcriptional regulator with XRE-family HTH domain
MVLACAKWFRYCSVMEQEPLNPTRLVGAQVAKVRKSRGMTQESLAEAMQEVGIDFERVVVAKLEKGLRPFVKLDEFLALCLVLEISPVDLLVPADMTDQTYRITPLVTAVAENAREWVRGESLIYAGLHGPESPFVSPVGGRDITTFTHWMPEERKRRVLQRWLDMEERDQWIAEEEEARHERWMAEQQQKEGQS